MEIDQVQQALDHAVATSNAAFDRKDWKESERWHHRAEALYELLHGPQDPKGH